MSYFTKNTRILVIDTETTNTLNNCDMSDVLIYDCGWAVCDILGNVYETASYVNQDIFFKEAELMKSAYYANKIPLYLKDIYEGKRHVAGIWDIRRELFNVIERYNIRYVAAYNARFDANALNRTISWITKSFARYFYRFNQIEWLDIMKMAQDAVVNTRNYKTWAIERGFVTKTGTPRKAAEIVFRYISGDDNFQEQHTGLADVLDEIQIMAFCFSERKRRKVKMRTKLYQETREWPEMTEFQRKLMQSLKENPILNWKTA